MEIVYIDSLFALNVLIDYFLLLCSARLCGAVLRRWRFAISAALGGAYAVLTVLPGFGFLSAAVMKLALAVAMCLVAFGGEERLARLTVAFLCVSAGFGGAVWGASMLAGTSLTGRLYTSVSMRVLLLSFALCYAAVSLVFRRTGVKPERALVDITLSFRGRTVELRALRDTGNGLYDPVSGKRVLVAESAALLPLLPLGAAEALGGDAADTAERLSVLPGCEGRVSLIPYSTVGLGAGLLPTLRPDAVTVDGRAAPLLVALSPGSLCDDGEYRAVV